jgi:prepilin-type N-terminal cleavage/methylation domain-containing protein
VATRRAGYTLFELIITLAVLAIMAGIAVPLSRHLMADTRVTAASDMVRARWTDTRTRALQEGRPYVFEVMQNSGKFKVRPVEEAEGGREYELPQNIHFQFANGGGASESYTPVVTFQSDGSAETDGDDDPMVTFGDPEGGRQVNLRLRRSTGTVTSEEAPPGNRP